MKRDLVNPYISTPQNLFIFSVKGAVANHIPTPSSFYNNNILFILLNAENVKSKDLI